MIGEALREYRRSKGITLIHIAKKLKRPISSMYALETGAVRLRVDEYIAICEGYGVKPGKFLSQVLGEDDGDGGAKETV